MEWLINRRRMMYNRATTPAYIPFEDEGIWRICCENFGDYNETVITNNGDGTVNIIVTFKSMLDRVVKKSVVISTQTNVDNTEGTYVEGTTKEAVGITMKQCKAVSNSSVSTVFQQNITVSNFTEFQYFTGVTATSTGMFDSMTITGTIILPPTITSLHSYTFRYSNIHRITLSEGITSPTWTWHVFYYCNAEEIVFPSTISIINNVWNNGSSRRNIIINGNTVIPAGTQSYVRDNTPLYVYVKDDLVDTYKANDSWIDNVGANKIYSISEYVES